MTNEGYLVGRTVYHGNSSLTRVIGQSAIDLTRVMWTQP